MPSVAQHQKLNIMSLRELQSASYKAALICIVYDSNSALPNRVCYLHTIQDSPTDKTNKISFLVHIFQN